MIIGIDIRTLMDARYSGVSEYTLNLIKEILKLGSSAASASSHLADSAPGIKGEKVTNEFRLFYNCFGDIRGQMRIKCGPTRNNVKIVDYGYPNKILNYFLFKFFNYPKIDKDLGADVFFMPHINFIGLSGRAKSLITIHDLSFLRNPDFFSWRKNFWHKMINVKKLVKRFDVVVAISENTKHDIIELCGVSPHKIKVIYSGAGEELKQLSIINYQLSIKKIQEKYNLPDKFILYLGTVEPRKNVEGVIKAYSELRVASCELRDYKLVIAGSKGWKSDKIYREWERSEFKDDIKFLGYIDRADKVYLYNLAAVFVYPSFYEGFGFPPLEAMACGLPVVASYSSSLSEVAGDAALMVDPYNINGLARAIKEILLDENLKNKLARRGLELAKKFSWGKTAREYLEMINKL